MQAKEIRSYILKNIQKHPNDIVAVTAAHFNVTRTTIHRHLTRLIQEHRIIKSGTTRNIKYYKATSLNRELSYKITPNLQEFNVLSKDFDTVFQQLPRNVYDICTYGFTEIFNNAIDHSQGTKIIAKTQQDKSDISISIVDDGIGIFKNIADYFKLEDLRESILQLNKGKMTTDPLHHSGEGIFFCARVFDVFEIYANSIHYVRNNIEKDWSLETLNRTKTGSQVLMTINRNSKTNLTDIFKKFQEPESLAFDRTEIVVALSKFGHETLISRSQAKRITQGLEKFREVILDFTNVRLVGQGFVDEVFRVFSDEHPEIKIHYIHANDDVTFMIERCLATFRTSRN